MSRGEFTITDALECMIHQGAKLQAFKVQNWFDCGQKRDPPGLECHPAQEVWRHHRARNTASITPL